MRASITCIDSFSPFCLPKKLYKWKSSELERYCSKKKSKSCKNSIRFKDFTVEGLSFTTDDYNRKPSAITLLFTRRNGQIKLKVSDDEYRKRLGPSGEETVTRCTSLKFVFVSKKMQLTLAHILSRQKGETHKLGDV